MGITEEYALNRNKEIAELRKENEDLKKAVKDLNKAIDAILYRVVRKYGSPKKGEVRIPIPDANIKCKVSVRKTGDVYIISAKDLEEE